MFARCSLGGQPDWEPAGPDSRQDGRPHPPHERDRQRHQGHQDVHVGGGLRRPRPGHQEVRPHFVYGGIIQGPGVDNIEVGLILSLNSPTWKLYLN